MPLLGVSNPEVIPLVEPPSLNIGLLNVLLIILYFVASKEYSGCLNQAEEPHKFQPTLHLFQEPSAAVLDSVVVGTDTGYHSRP